MPVVSQAAIDYFLSLSPKKFVKQLKDIGFEEAKLIVSKLGKKEVNRILSSIQEKHEKTRKQKSLRKLEEREQLDCEEQRRFRNQQHKRTTRIKKT